MTRREFARRLRVGPFNADNEVWVVNVRMLLAATNAALATERERVVEDVLEEFETAMDGTPWKEADVRVRIRRVRDRYAAHKRQKGEPR